MSQKLKEVDQELRRGYMSIFLIRYVLKACGSRPGAPKMIYDIFLIRYVLKAQGSRPGAPKSIYEYIPY